MKKFLSIILVLISLHGWTQKSMLVTESFMVEGKVKQPQSFSMQDLSGLQLTSIDSIVITNHLHEKKSVLKNIKGVLLKDVLNKLTIDQANPKLLSEYYFVCIASDNYKAVFSWNEIFNNETGNHVMIITEQNGKKGSSMDNRIALISSADKATGRRYVKGLQKILVERVP
ncbi:MAG: molybdopterin-binding protein [Ferruginibacter sp.]